MFISLRTSTGTVEAVAPTVNFFSGRFVQSTNPISKDPKICVENTAQKLVNRQRLTRQYWVDNSTLASILPSLSG